MQSHCGAAERSAETDSLSWKLTSSEKLYNQGRERSQEMNVGILGSKSNGPDGFKNWLEEVAFGLRFLLSSEHLLQGGSGSKSCHRSEVSTRLQDNTAFGTDRPCCISKQQDLAGVDLQRKTAGAEARYLQTGYFALSLAYHTDLMTTRI